MTDVERTAVDTVIEARKSVRAYKKDPVPLELITHVLEVASRAPSATNMQPWKVYVLTGDALARTTIAVSDAFDGEPGQYRAEYPYYPAKHFEPYLSRRRKLGYDLYGLVGIPKGDKEKMHAQQRRNYTFFDAPVGLLFTLHRDLPCGNFIDYGAFLENVMLSAKSHGLDTCLQAGWSDYHTVLRKVLPIDKTEMVLAGMALGHADPKAPVNRLVTEREPVSSFTTFLEK